MRTDKYKNKRIRHHSKRDYWNVKPDDTNLKELDKLKKYSYTYCYKIKGERKNNYCDVCNTRNCYSPIVNDKKKKNKMGIKAINSKKCTNLFYYQ